WAAASYVYNTLIYENEIYRPLEIGETVKAYVKNVRPDGKLDLTLSGTENDRVNELAERIMDRLDREPDRFLPMGDFSTPEAIKEVFQCSKKDFKKAIGHLFRDHRITISPAGIKKEN
ncbi:MAG: GntR family transcriptional regulator, partial [Duncaniella sp.]|nr:GntR family transcriptional regulator [Duncaniella sp.]